MGEGHRDCLQGPGVVPSNGRLTAAWAVTALVLPQPLGTRRRSHCHSRPHLIAAALPFPKQMSKPAAKATRCDYALVSPLQLCAPTRAKGGPR